MLEDCPECRGTGKSCTRSITRKGICYTLRVCVSCGRTGVTGRLVRCFDNDSPAVELVANENGFVTCPTDGCRRFTITDPDAWTGLRHKKCGQKLIVSQK